MNYLHDCSYGRPYLLGFRESIRLSKIEVDRRPDSCVEKRARPDESIILAEGSELQSWEMALPSGQ